MGPELDLSGRVVAVAGAGGGGIGTAVAGAVASAGGRVLAIDNRPEAFQALDAALASTPGPHHRVVADATDAAQVDAALAEGAALGPLSGLVHVAGGMRGDQWARLIQADPSLWDEVVGLNLGAPARTIPAAARRMAAEGTPGSIVAVASVVGLSAMPYGAPYAAAKAGLMSLVRTAAVECGPLGIRVNAVAPGTVRTAKNAATSGPENDAERIAVPLGRRGRAEDIANAVLFLLSDLAGWVTGQVLAVDGGSSARPSFLDADDLPVFVHDPALRARLNGGVSRPATTAPER